MPLRRENGFLPDLDARSRRTSRRARRSSGLNYPNNPTAALRRARFYEEAGRVRAEARHHRRLRRRLLRGLLRRGARRRVVPRVAGRDGRRHRVPLAVEDLQHDRLARRLGLRQPETRRRPRQGQDERRLRRVPGGAGGAASPRSVDQACVAELRAIYRERREVLCGGLEKAGFDVIVAEATFYCLVAARRALTSPGVHGEAPHRGGRGGDAGDRLRRVRRGLRAPDRLRRRRERGVHAPDRRRGRRRDPQRRRGQLRFDQREPVVPQRHAMEEFTLGQFKIPFGFEVLQSSSDREMPERTAMARALYPGERDRGGRMMYTYDWFRLWFRRSPQRQLHQRPRPRRLRSDQLEGRGGACAGRLRLLGFRGLVSDRPLSAPEPPGHHGHAGPRLRKNYERIREIGGDVQGFFDIPAVGGMQLRASRPSGGALTGSETLPTSWLTRTSAGTRTSSAGPRPTSRTSVTTSDLWFASTSTIRFQPARMNAKNHAPSPTVLLLRPKTR